MYCKQVSLLFLQEDDGDTVSLFVFGEEEDSLAKEAAKSNGVIDYNKVKDHHFQIDKSLHRFSVDGTVSGYTFVDLHLT